VEAENAARRVLARKPARVINFSRIDSCAEEFIAGAA